MQDTLRAEYDIKNLRFRKMGPGRKSFGNAVALEPDVAAVFSSAAAVNVGLRFLIKVTRENVPGAAARQQE